MRAIDLLKRESEMAYSELLTSLDGVSEGQAWSVLPQLGKDYLHSDASIHGIALHVATCKIMYGSVGFRKSEVRWRDCAERVGGFEPSWSAALDYLKEAQAYWVESWKDLEGSDLEGQYPHFSGSLWPGWKIIRTVIDHDAYHAGQIAILKYGCPESDIRPPSVAEDIRKYCSELPDW